MKKSVLYIFVISVCYAVEVMVIDTNETISDMCLNFVTLMLVHLVCGPPGVRYNHKRKSNLPFAHANVWMSFQINYKLS